MNSRFASTIATALFATAGLGTSALAQDKAAAASAPKADKTQVVPGRQDLKPYPATVEKLDDNTQRIHDRDRDSAAKPQGSASGVKATANAGAQENKQALVVRDWAAIDTNKDNLISPDEMEAALKAVGPQAKPAPAQK